jgi:phosphoglycerate dehydrogenase-like enzyme
MKAGSVLINVARGEIIDEEALADALCRDHLRGAALDVYVGEFEHAPMARLRSDPRVLITPHISGASDQDRHRAINIFCANLRAYLDGGPLRNGVDSEGAISSPPLGPAPSALKPAGCDSHRSRLWLAVGSLRAGESAPPGA